MSKKSNPNHISDSYTEKSPDRLAQIEEEISQTNNVIKKLEKQYSKNSSIPLDELNLILLQLRLRRTKLSEEQWALLNLKNSDRLRKRLVE